jgi:hypothetical protein
VEGRRVGGLDDRIIAFEHATAQGLVHPYSSNEPSGNLLLPWLVKTLLALLLLRLAGRGTEAQTDRDSWNAKESAGSGHTWLGYSWL